MLKKKQEQQFACQGGQPEAGRKHIKNENLLYDEMQSLPTWQTKYFQRGYWELAMATEEVMSAALGKWVHKDKKINN